MIKVRVIQAMTQIEKPTERFKKLALELKCIELYHLEYSLKNSLYKYISCYSSIYANLAILEPLSRIISV